MEQRLLGKYILQERLGHDEQSETWKALDTQQQRLVAVKIIRIKPETSSEFTSRFQRESQAVVVLQHPAIIATRECVLSENGDEAYIVSDFVEGPSLMEYFDTTSHAGKIPAPTEIVALLSPLAAALDYAHQRGVVHGRLRPADIYFDTQTHAPPLAGAVKVGGFALRQKGDLRLLSTEDAAYVAPEVAKGNAPTSRSDLYSLGVILYELCTGALPFQGESASDILMQHIQAAPPSPALINPQLRPALILTIMRSLSKEPAERYSSAASLVGAVAKALNVRSVDGTSLSYSSYAAMNPVSQSGIQSHLDPADAPTHLVPRPQLAAAPTVTPPPVVNPISPNTPPLQPPPVVPSSTPVLPAMTTGSASTVQAQAQPATETQAHRASMPADSRTPSMSPMSWSQAIPVVQAPPASSVPIRKRRLGILPIALIVGLIIVLIGSGLLATQIFSANRAVSTSQQSQIGHVFFTSSGLINTESNSGVTDGLQVSLQNISNPQPGKRYYGWLTNTNGTDVPALGLGPLNINDGKITLTYVSPQHSNLLANYNRFLITEEDSSQQPLNPSLDNHTWRYSATFSTTPNPNDPKRYSLFDHMRHLLSQDPKLKGVGIPGGLDEWLYRNTSKILEAAGSARDAQKGCIAAQNASCTNFILRQDARILDYLDGAAYVQTENIPTSIQGEGLLIDPTIARVALLEFDPVHQEPPGYLKHIGSHLSEISQISAATPQQRSLAIHINQDINNVQGWLNAVHADAAKLIHMDSNQLLQPEALATLNDLFNQANAAFVGQVDPNTNNVKEGVVQIHYSIQSLATFNVAPCAVKNGQNTCAA